MGAHSEYMHGATLKETYYKGTTVAATAGYLVLDERFASQSPEPVLAWRVGNELVLPITRWGVVARECWVAYPDGIVRHHWPATGSEVPSFASIAEWRASGFGTAATAKRNAGPGL